MSTKHFPKAHLWLMAPFFVAFSGFYFSYWSKFSQIPFHQHLHGLTATLWFLLLILQPYLYLRKSLKMHRKLGLIGVFLAGALVFSAMQIIPQNIRSETLSPVLKYGLSYGDFIFLAGFSFSMIMAVVHKAQLSSHARYMIATAFWAMLPALSRLIYFPLVINYGYPPPLTFIEVIYISTALVILVLGIMMYRDYRKERKVYRAYWLVAAGNLLFACTFEFVGSSTWWINVCHTILK